MAAKPLTSEAIALTEKKMDMTLDDIIKMSKNSTKAKKQQRAPIKSQKPVNNAAKEKALKVRQYMDSRSSLRQGVLAQRRSNFQGNRFPLAAEAARRAAIAPIRVRAFNGSRVANMNKPSRIGAPPVQRRAVNGGFAAKPHHHHQQQQQQQQQQQEQQGNVATKQRPQTLDSLFANMKEQRMRVLSRQNNTAQRNGGGRQRMPWGRGRFGN
ncbi:uncharacterized protein LOC110422328 isoform X1 [Herrania umbratica]|uniref:Uncharacterized protein LOC110422328 isoform X1 n=1 Tax=Herrania umbratica TaxID=108875 RepID=A0A6J1AY06_9ROSI|nr:uncharacterized protein LOC110422328 isoform X1 [Herrania umbratica]